MKNKLYLLLLIGSLCLSAKAQDFYSTRHGDIALSIGYRDTILLMVSNQLEVQLNYETSDVSFRVPFSTFRTGVDSIDRRLIALRDTSLEFNGRLGIAIDTKNYSQQNYNMEGTLTSSVVPVPVKGIGSMTCLPTANRITPACTLLLTMESTLWVLRLANIFPTAKMGVRIDVRQSILERQP